MLGTYDRELIQREYDEKKKEIDEDKAQYEAKKQNVKEEFEEKKNSALEEIDSELQKFKLTKADRENAEKEKAEKIKQLESEKNAYTKIAENYRKDIDKMILEFNSGKTVDNARMSNARTEYAANILKIETVEKEIKDVSELEYKSVEENMEEYDDLSYLKTRIRAMDVSEVGKLKEDQFVVKYEKGPKDIEPEKPETEEPEQEKTENPETEKSEPEKTEQKKPEPQNPNPQNLNKKIKIELLISQNKIKINNSDENYYKAEAKNKKELLKDADLAIKSYFIKDKKAMKNIDYALLSVFKNIDTQTCHGIFKCN